jgi:acid phosphatase (class A)
MNLTCIRIVQQGNAADVSQPPMWDTVLRKVLLVLACIAITAGCASIERQSESFAVPERSPGYLSSEVLPNSEAFIPPPPAAGSVALSLDEAVSRDSLALRDSSRWMLAAEDANLMFPRAAGAFSCALNAPITEQDTPHLLMLMLRTPTDASLSAFGAKNKYMRTRPFVVKKERTCSPDDEGYMMKSGSYPSGHSAIGWTWALILSEISPEQADAILARGRAFGQSRVICNVHWQSDVIEGFFVGAAIVARLHADAVFRADIETAKTELSAVRAKGLKPTRDCKAEADALSCGGRPYISK